MIDSGIDFTHPDLHDNQWTNSREINGNSIDDDHNGLVDDVHGWDWSRGDNVIRDEHGHGTSMAGITADARRQLRRHHGRDVARLADEPAHTR
ncbi:MAG: S8 family serine peptidase [Pyrinomonadaceae bacterium]